MNMRSYPILHLDTNWSKGTALLLTGFKILTNLSENLYWSAIVVFTKKGGLSL